MNPQEFTEKLDEARELMSKENYPEAIVILEELKAIEKQGEFDYNLTHKLYQLISNASSLNNQKIILNTISSISKDTESITFEELRARLNEKNELSLDTEILRREIELLILRNQLSTKISGDNLIL